MRRTVSAHLELDLQSRTDLIFSIAVAQGANIVTESLTFNAGGNSVQANEIIGKHGTRLHRLLGEPGSLVVDYQAEVDGRTDPVPVDEIDLITYRRPSRYCESDTLGPTAHAEFGGLGGKELLDAVSSWVGGRLTYIPGASRPTDGAVSTLLARQGVCRDYAHLVVALLRALDVPARLAAVYAPGLNPMDFHAVAEAFVDNDWHVVDATAMAPRSSLLRISAGQDAADTAFLSQHWGGMTLRDLQVSALVDDLPADDLTQLVRLG